MVLYYFATVQQINFRETCQIGEYYNKLHKITSFIMLENFLKTVIGQNM
jgi:hypothetical protein